MHTYKNNFFFWKQLSFCSFFLLQKRKFSPQVNPHAQTVQEKKLHKFKKKRKLPKIGDEGNKKAVSATKRTPRSEINLHSVTPENFIFTLEIENKVLKNLHFKAYKKDTSAFVRKLLSVYRKTLWRLEWNAFTFASERQSDFSGFSFFILPGRPFHSPSTPSIDPCEADEVFGFQKAAAQKRLFAARHS